MAWRHLVYWDLFFGYVSYKRVDDLWPEAEQWLCSFVRLGGPLGEDEYLEALYTEVTAFLQREWKVPVEHMTVSEWCTSGKWMEGKAGTGSKLTVEVGGKRLRTRRMKPLEGVFHGDSDIKQELSMPCREYMYVVQKSESGKIRPVVKTGNCLNRKMNCLSEVVERGFHGSRASTLFAGEKGNEEIDMDLLNAVRDDSDWCVPLDQGAFDQHQSKKSIMVVIAAVFNHVLPRVGDAEYSAVAAALWDSLNVRGAHVVSGSREGEWTNGLPSGWRWTAILDTLLNIGSFKVVGKLAGAIGGRLPSIRHHYAQGYDVVFTCPSLWDIRTILTVYGALGYSVHPQKTYASRSRAEFLRRSYEPWGVTGYSARTLGGLRFRNPIQEVPMLKGERLFSRLVQRHLAYIRGAWAPSVAAMLLEDVQQMGLSVLESTEYFLTPSSVGGGGLDPESGLGRELSYLVGGVRSWRCIEVYKQARVASVNLGAWNRRLDEASVELSASARKVVVDNLLASWGIRERDRVKTAEFRLVPVTPRSGYVPLVRGTLPSDHEVWDLDHVPTQVRGVVKRESVSRGTYAKYMKPGWASWTDWLKHRVSLRVFQGVMNGDFTVPCVLTDNVGLRYGKYIKDQAQQMLEGTLTSKDCSLLKVETACLGIENFLRTEFQKGVTQLTTRIVTRRTGWGQSTPTC